MLSKGKEEMLNKLVALDKSENEQILFIRSIQEQLKLLENTPSFINKLWDEVKSISATSSELSNLSFLANKIESLEKSVEATRKDQIKLKASSSSCSCDLRLKAMERSIQDMSDHLYQL